MVPYLNKLESPSPNGTVGQVWLKLSQGFWRRRFLNFVNVFSLFRNFLPLEKGVGHLSNKLKLLCPGMFYAKFCWNWLCGSGEEEENVKSLQTVRRTTGAQKSSLELSDQVSLNVKFCRQTDGQKDNGSELKARLSFQFWRAKTPHDRFFHWDCYLFRTNYHKLGLHAVFQRRKAKS